MKQHHPRRLAAFVTTTALIGASVIAGALTSPGQIVALPGPEESTVVNVDPTRVLDTRFDVGLTGKFQSRVPRKLMVTGMIETFVEVTNTKTTKQVIPAGATGVIMNVTAVLPTAGGFLSVRPGTANGLPSTAGLNFETGDVIPNHVSVALPTSGPNAGQIDLTYVAAVVGPTMDVVIDIVGYTTSSGLADLVALVGTKANSADVYAKTDTYEKSEVYARSETYAKSEVYVKPETYSKIEVDAAIAAKAPIARSAWVLDVIPDPAALTSKIVLSVTIEAPTAGIIQIVGSSLVFAGAPGLYQCSLTLGAGVLVGPGALTRAVTQANPNDFETCVITGAITVAAGTHVVNLVVFSDVGGDYDRTALDAVFYPDGTLTPPRSSSAATTHKEIG